MTALWLPGMPLLDSEESYAIDELNPTVQTDPDPWKETTS